MKDKKRNKKIRRMLPQTYHKSNDALINEIMKPEEHKNTQDETPIVAIDCEMVEIDGSNDGLARVSIVNYFGHTLMDDYVQPEGKITDYRTWVSGIRPEDLLDSIPFSIARKKAIQILKGKTIVGHSVQNDFTVLQYEPKSYTVRDTTKYKKLQDKDKQSKSLKRLSGDVLNITIQEGEHSSVVDARATLALYRVCEKEWERQLKRGQWNSQVSKNKKIKKE